MRTELPGVEAAARVEAPQGRAEEKPDTEEHERRSEQVHEPVHHVLLDVAGTLEGQEREDPLSADGRDGHDAIPDFGLLVGEEAHHRVQGVHGGFQSRGDHSGAEHKHLEDEQSGGKSAAQNRTEPNPNQTERARWPRRVLVLVLFSSLLFSSLSVSLFLRLTPPCVLFLLQQTGSSCSCTSCQLTHNTT